MASKIVVLPDPLGPVMANRPASRSGGRLKWSSHSPFNEFIFLNRRVNIFIVLTYPVVMELIKKAQKNDDYQR
jgi:hypothetical protein